MVDDFGGGECNLAAYSWVGCLAGDGGRNDALVLTLGLELVQLIDVQAKSNYIGGDEGGFGAE